MSHPPSSTVQLLSLERAAGPAGRLSSTSTHSESSDSAIYDASRPFLQQDINRTDQRNSSSSRTSASWRQQYSVTDSNYIDYHTSLFARPLRRLTWKETGHLLLVNTAMFWPNYLYPSPDRRKVTPERRRRLLFSYAPGECRCHRHATCDHACLLTLPVIACNRLDHYSWSKSPVAYLCIAASAIR